MSLRTVLEPRIGGELERIIKCSLKFGIDRTEILKINLPSLVI